MKEDRCYNCTNNSIYRDCWIKKHKENLEMWTKIKVKILYCPEYNKREEK